MRKELGYYCVLFTMTLSLCGQASSSVAQKPPSTVRLISATSDNFNALSERASKNLTNDPLFAPLKIFSVIVHNETQFPVRALSLKWTFIKSDGSQSTKYTTFLPEPSHGYMLVGRQDAIGPDKLVLASPFGYVEENSSSRAALSALNPKVGDKTLGTYNRVLVHLDAVVYGSGLVVGRDETHLREHFHCEQSGSISEARSLIPFLTSEDQLHDKLNEDVVRFQYSKASCDYSRARAAMRFRSVEIQRGESFFEQNIRALSKREPLLLHQP